MKKIMILWLSICSIAYGQDKTFDIEMHYGPQFSNYAKYEQDPSEVPDGFLSWYDKDKIGTVFGSEINWNLKKGTSKSTLGFLYERQVNVGKQNGQFFTDQGTRVIIRDFKLRNINNFYALQYKYRVSSQSKLIAGLYMVNESQQEIDYLYTVTIEERNAKNSGLQDGGIYLGGEYYFYDSGRFSLGVKSKFYYTITLGDFETFNLTPSLKYNF